MTFSPYARLLIAISAALTGAFALRADVLPAGTKLEIRLSTAVGSHVSRVGDPMSATVIAPAVSRDRLLTLQGATISGAVDSVESIGLGLKHRIAKIRISFDSIHLASGTVLPIQGRVQEVETSRERVDHQGTIDGIEPTANLSSGISFGISALMMNPVLAGPAIGVKFLAARSPDSEIYLPVGTELFFELTKDVSVSRSVIEPQQTAPLNPEEIASVQHLLQGLPQQQAVIGHTHASDLVNLMLLGTPDQIEKAFRAGGWTGENRHGVKELYGIYHCLVQRKGYSMAPMARLTLNGSLATKVYQKSLDTFSKRHHIRLWDQPDTSAWLGAATEDVGFTIRRMHWTHATDREIDNERAKVVNDLWFTGCVEAGSLLPRASLKPDTEKGVSIVTDGDIAVLKLNSCEHPRIVSTSPLEVRHRSRAREVMSAMATDIARSNPLTVGYSLAGSIWEHSNSEGAAPKRENAIRPGNAFLPQGNSATERSESRRPSVIDPGIGPDSVPKNRPLNAELAGTAAAN